LWNPKTREFCGRGVGSWIKLVVFMTLFSAGVASFWGLCLWVFYQVSILFNLINLIIIK
jgi:hypothetical protein